MNDTQFIYTEAFSRNIGWVTEFEQLLLKQKKVAIAGLGGVGGFHLTTLARLGVGQFNIADFDIFELGNFNRQIGANTSTLGLDKSKVLCNMALDINPEASVACFGEINEDNVLSFLEGVDLYIDGIDLFNTKARELLFQKCHELKIPAITAAPIGMGVSYMVFDNESMSFEDYFQWKNQSEETKLINFIIGLTPSPFHVKYLVDKSRLNFKRKLGPSTVMACNLCAGVTGVEALKILLNRGLVYKAPYCNQFDAYKYKYKRSYIRSGNSNFKQRIKAKIVRKLLYKQIDIPVLNPEIKEKSVIKEILNTARWAPSGDNLQPWRFKIVNDNELIIKIVPDLDEHFYDFDGKPTLISVGCLLQTLQLAANQYHLNATWTLRKNNGDSEIHVMFKASKKNQDKENLAQYIVYRSVNRNPYQKKMPPQPVLDKLNTLLDPQFSINFITDPAVKKKIVSINMLSTQIRVTLKQSHDALAKMIQWNKQSAPIGISYTNTGMNKYTAELFKRIFKNWGLMRFLSRNMGLGLSASVELDYLPGKNSAGFFILTGNKSLDEMSNDELLTIGMNIQKIWLYLTKHNIAMQPSFKPVMLAYHLRHNSFISDDPKIQKKLERLISLYKSAGFSDKTLFIARFGYACIPQTEPRSIRLNLNDLIYD